MNQEVLNSKTLVEWWYSDNMEFNGYSYINRVELAAKSDNPCYIAENAEKLHDIQSYQDMKKEAEVWISDNGDEYCESIELDRKELTPDYLIDEFFSQDDVWSFFSTFLNDINS